MESNTGKRRVWGLGLRLMVVACSSISIIAANATRTGGIVTDSVSGIDLSIIQLSEVNEISVFQRKLPAATAAPINRRAVIALDGVDIAMKQASKLKHDRVSESNPHMMGNWEKAEGDVENDDKIRMERLLRFSDYVDPIHHPPQQPPSLIDP